MLERITHPNGIVTYQSPLLRALKIPHAFSTRIGGISPAPFAALNLGNPSEGPHDSLENIRENYRRLQEAIACPAMPRAWVKQVHGRAIEVIEREPENEYAETLAAELRDRFSGQTPADGMVCVVPGVLLSIRVADCVPILLADERGKMVAALHAGWRGVVGNIAGRGVRAMGELGVPPEQIVAAIGPAISAEHFEVGEEVAEAFSREGLQSAVVHKGTAKPHIDLQHAVKTQLQAAGITRIDGNDLCTVRDSAEFFSHRRDKGITGRMAALIAAGV